MFVASVVIFALVTILLAVSFRAKPVNANEGRMERLWIVGLGIGFSMLILACLLGYGIVAGERLAAKPDDGVVEVAATADRLGWTFTYADKPGHMTRNTLHVPAEKDVLVSIRSVDVIHSFWVPRLAGKLDAIPGHTNRLKLRTDSAGIYAGQSSEYSGPHYHHHRFEVIAHDLAGWESFLHEAQP